MKLDVDFTCPICKKGHIRWVTPKNFREFRVEDTKVSICPQCKKQSLVYINARIVPVEE